jgi:chemotaxis signal transduction protein
MSEIDKNLHQRILRLERQVLELRKHLQEGREPLGEEHFKALEIRVGSAWYALQLSRIHEVVAMLRPEPLPESPDWVLGKFLYGDEVVTLVDLQRRLDGKSTELEASLSIVLVHDGGGQLAGFAVEEIRQIFDVEPRDVSVPSPDIPQAPFVLGTLRRDGRILHLLSTERLSGEPVLEATAEPAK